MTNWGKYANCPENGSVENDTCTFTRKLCVTCREDNGQVRVRVQSNSVPNHGYAAVSDIIDIHVDYEVDWL